MPDSKTSAMAVKIDQETREMVRKRAIDAWEECRATGLHVTCDEIITWLECWGDEGEKPAPLCHK